MESTRRGWGVVNRAAKVTALIAAAVVGLSACSGQEASLPVDVTDGWRVCLEMDNEQQIAGDYSGIRPDRGLPVLPDDIAYSKDEERNAVTFNGVVEGARFTCVYNTFANVAAVDWTSAPQTLASESFDSTAGASEPNGEAMTQAQIADFYTATVCGNSDALRAVNAISIKPMPTRAEMETLPALIPQAQAILLGTADRLLSPPRPWPSDLRATINERAAGSRARAAAYSTLLNVDRPENYRSKWDEVLTVLESYRPASLRIQEAAGLPEDFACPLAPDDQAFVDEFRKTLSVERDRVSDTAVLSYGDSMCAMFGREPTLADVSEWVIAAGFAEVAESAGSLIGGIAIRHLCPEYESVVRGMQ